MYSQSQLPAAETGGVFAPGCGVPTSPPNRSYQLPGLGNPVTEPLIRSG